MGESSRVLGVSGRELRVNIKKIIIMMIIVIIIIMIIIIILFRPKA